MRRVACIGLWVLCFPGVPASAGAHSLNESNTHVSLEVRRFGLHWFSAEFHQLRGEFTAEHGGGALNVVVRTDSIDCRDAVWNQRLRSAQWLDTARYPQMVYRSSRIELTTPGSATVHGELTLHGVTRPLTLLISELACSEVAARAPLACRFSGQAELRRSDFGLPHGFWEGGDAVQIVVRGE